MSKFHNYHKHTHYSNLRTLDCVVKPEDYMKRAVELRHDSYFTTEHGWGGNIYEAQTLCKKYGLKCIFGVEAYYVDDMNEKTNRTAYHIVLVAMNENGRKAINSIISMANTQGYYYKPRIDLKSLLSLPSNDVVVTTACVAGRPFKTPNWENEFLFPLVEHFKSNFLLEVQNHTELIQKEYNKDLLKVSQKNNIPIIHGCDTHYIYQKDSQYRDMFLRAKGIFYEEETNFILDYPDSKTIFERYDEQGVLNKLQVETALKNTLIFDNAEPINIDKSFKIPKIVKGDSDVELKKIIKKSWDKEKRVIKKENIPKYEKAIYEEVKIIEKCRMADYFTLNQKIINKAVNDYNAVLTKSGRGSSVSFYINKLLGLTEVDRLKAPITLYPTRFMSAERILESKSLPDIDLNFADVKPVIKAAKDILGEDNVYYMVAYKPLQESSAFRLWCKAKGLNINEYDEIAKNLELYNEDKKWSSVIEESKVFRGVIESVAPSPCSFLLLDKAISSEVGLIKVGNEICCCLDGYNCDVYKYLKDDFLTVKVYDIIDKVYKAIGRPIDDISTLINNCNDKVWDIYAKGLTTTINQSDSDFGKQTLKRYKPTSLAEMSAWVAAIRPGFASLLNNFLDRLPYSTGVDELDKILEDSFHYLMYQESIMKYLVWLGLEEKNTYDIIKKISKKKFTEDELNELESQLFKGWKDKIGTEEGFKETWQVVMDAAHYSFNASHSLSVAIDSIYGAYLKSHYPLEYYSVVLTLYSDDMERTANLIAELPYFDISVNPIKFGKSGSEYTIDRENNSIYKGISSIKYCNSVIAEELLDLSNDKKYDSFIELLKDIKEKTSLNSRQLTILTGLDFFSDFGKNKYLLNIIEVFDKFASIKVLSKAKLESLGINEAIAQKYSEKETKSQYRNIDCLGLIKEIISKFKQESLSVQEQIKFDVTYLEYATYTNSKIDDCYYIITEFKTYKDVSRPYLKLYNLKTGEDIKTKIKRGSIFKNNPFGQFSILKVEGFTYEFKKKKIGDEWVTTDETEPILEEYEVIKD